MCTVTIVPLDDNGFRLVCNRDERRARPDARAPMWRRAGDGMAAFPIDPLGGGTWIGVNDAGIAMAVLNRTLRAEEQRTSTPSRGLIIPALMGCRSFDAVVEAARARIGRDRFAPFTLVVADGHQVGTIANGIDYSDQIDHSDDGDSSEGDDSNGLSVEVQRFAHPLMFTSSSLGDEVVEPRRRLFELLVLKDSSAWLIGQFRFHRAQWTARPDISVLMERPDARTVSRTVVEVSAHEVRLAYEPLAPHGNSGRQAA